MEWEDMEWKVEECGLAAASQNRYVWMVRLQGVEAKEIKKEVPRVNSPEQQKVWKRDEESVQAGWIKCMV